ncbi:MAG TPA: T9SS type A sorting domain-containing protein, partial [Chryseosolibacter sp.]|nr:T9SS type A sorting domain-containing protein [Chryseosolibacter sp.]
ACGGSYSEMMHCNGYINFTNSGSGAREALNSGSPEPESASESKLTAYPNPVADHVRVMLSDSGSEKLLQIFDASGKTVTMEKTCASEHVFDMSHCRSGLYVIQVIDMSGRSTIKINKK